MQLDRLRSLCFKCECGSRHVGRTQRLSERIKQHVPSVIRKKTVPLRNKPKRHCTSAQTINCDSAIGQHLSNRCCANTYSDSKFIILAKCRSAFFLKIMESMYIKFNDPDLCRQKEFVFSLALFWCLIPPTWDDIIAFTSGINISW